MRSRTCGRESWRSAQPSTWVTTSPTTIWPLRAAAPSPASDLTRYPPVVESGMRKAPMPIASLLEVVSPAFVLNTS